MAVSAYTDARSVRELFVSVAFIPSFASHSSLCTSLVRTTIMNSGFSIAPFPSPPYLNLFFFVVFHISFGHAVWRVGPQLP